MVGGTEIVRNASKVSRGLVSVQSRLNQVVDESSSVGQALTKWYEAHNIAIYDQQGQLRTLYDVLGDVSQIWDSLSKNEQAYYLNQQAGANQTQNLAAILQNYDHVIEATNTALNSAGSAAQENSKYMESLEAQTKKLSATFEELSNKVIPSDLISGILKLANAFLEIVNTPVGTVVTQFVLLTGAITGLVGIVGPFIVKFGTLVKNLFEGGAALKGLIKNFAGFAAAVSGGEKGLTKMLASALPFASKFSLIITLLGAGVAIFDAFTTSLSEQKEKVATLSQELSGLRSEYEQLSSKDNLTADEERRLQLLEAQIKANDILLKQEAQKQYEKEFGESSYRAGSNEQVVTGLEQLNLDIDQLKQYQDAIVKVENEILNLDENSEDYADTVIELTEKKNKLTEQMNTLNGEVNTNINSLSDLGTKMGGLNSEAQNTVGAYLEFSNSMNQAEDSVQSLSDKIKQFTSIDVMPKNASDMEEWLNSLEETDLNNFIELLELAGKNSKQLGQFINQLDSDTALTFINEAVKRYTGQIGDATAATNKFEEALKMDYSEPIKDMATAMDYIQKSETQGIKNYQAYQAALEMVYGTANKDTIAFINSQIESNQQINKGTDALQNYFSYIKNGEFDSATLLNNIVEIAKKNSEIVEASGSVENKNLQLQIKDFHALAMAIGFTDTALRSALEGSEAWGEFNLDEPINAATKSLKQLYEVVQGGLKEKINQLWTVPQLIQPGTTEFNVNYDNIDEAKQKFKELQDSINKVSELTGVEFSFNFDEANASQIAEYGQQLYDAFDSLSKYISDSGNWDFSALEELEGVTIDGSKIKFEGDPAAQNFVDSFLGSLEGTPFGEMLSANLLDTFEIDTTTLNEEGKKAVSAITQGAEQGLTTSQQALQGIFTDVATDMGITIEQAGKVQSAAKEAAGSVDDLNNTSLADLASQFSTTGSSAQGFYGVIDAIQAKLNKLTNKTYTITTAYIEGGSARGHRGYAMGKQPDGAEYLRADSNGKDLVGEEGPELLVASNGKQRIVGQNGPELIGVNRGDTIIPANVTSMLRNNQISGFAGGYTSGSANYYSSPGKISLGELTSAYDDKKITGSVTSNTSAKSSLATASKQAAKATKELSDALKEQKELFDEQNEILEHQIFLREKQGAGYDELIALNKQYQDQIHEQANYYRKQGLDDNHEILRELQRQWWAINDDITDLQRDAFDERLQMSEDYIEKRNELNDWGADSEIAAWNRVLEWQEDWYKKGLIDYKYYAKKRKEAAEELTKAERKALEKTRDAYEALFSVVSNNIDKEIEALNKKRGNVEAEWDAKIEAVQKANDALDEQIEKEQALDNIARARQTKVMVYKDGRFQYVNDIDKVSEAQENLAKINREQQLRQEVERLEKLKNEALANIDEQIEGWEKYKERWGAVVENYKEKQDMLLVEQQLGIKLEGENWKERLDNLEGYIEEYEALMDRLNNAQKTEQAQGGLEGGAGGDDWLAQAQQNSEAWHSATSQAEKDRLHQANKDLYESHGWEYDNHTGTWSPGKGGGTSSGGGGGGSSSSGSGGSKKPSASQIAGSVAGGIISGIVGGIMGSMGGKKKKAKGTLSAEGGISLVGEQGPELRVLNHGDGIIPHNLTKNLWEWGSISPSDYIHHNLDFGSMGNQETNIVIQNFNPNLSSVQDGAGFARYMKENFARDVVQFVGRRG